MRSIPRTSGVWPLRLFQGFIVSVALCFLGLGLAALDRSDGPPSHRLAIDVQQVNGAVPAHNGDEKFPVAHHWRAVIERPIFMALVWRRQSLQCLHEGGLRPLQCAPKTSPPLACC